MNFSRRTLFIFVSAFICLFVAAAGAQKKLVDSRTFWDAKSSNRVHERKRSVETFIEELKDGSVVFTTTRVYQYLSEDKYRFYHKTTTPEGTSAEAEEIRVGHFLYRRENSGPWTKEDLRMTGSGVGIGSGSGGAYSALSQITVESVFLGNWPADLYEALTVIDGKSGLDLKEERIWIGHDGSLLREEIINGTFSPRVITDRMVRKYEYDSNVKIEAPMN